MKEDTVDKLECHTCGSLTAHQICDSCGHFNVQLALPKGRMIDEEEYA